MLFHKSTIRLNPNFSQLVFRRFMAFPILKVLYIIFEIKNYVNNNLLILKIKIIFFLI